MLHEGSSSDRPVRSTTRRIPTRRSPGDQVISVSTTCELFTSISPVSEDPKVDYRSTVRLQVPDSVRKGFCFYRCIIVVLDFNTRLVPDEGRLVVRVSTVQRPRLPTICTPYVCYVFQLVVSQTEDTSSACSLSSLGSRSSLSEIFRFEFVITIMDHKISSVLLVIRVTTVVTVVCKEGREGNKGDTAVIGIVIKVYITCKMSFNIDCEQVSLLSTLNMGITGNLG
ncbi:hypothetical protein KCU70_g22, partial [Aureobasidium melanogenum]